MPNWIINVKEKGAKKASKNIKGLNASLGGLAKNAALAAGSFFGAAMLLSGIKKAITLAGEQEMAETKLEAAIGKNIDGLKKYAATLQQQTLYGDEVILNAQAMLGAFIKDEEQMKLATIATLDLAAAKGFDLVTAADLVGKSVGSSTNALTRYGVVVEGAVGSTERLESLTRNVGTLFGGQAAAQADTMAGKIIQMNNAIGDAAEEIGAILSPVIIDLAEDIKFIAEWWDHWLNRGEEVTKTTKHMSSALTSLDIGISGAGLKIKGYTNILDDFDTTQRYATTHGLDFAEAQKKLGEDLAFQKTLLTSLNTARENEVQRLKDEHEERAKTVEGLEEINQAEVRHTGIIIKKAEVGTQIADLIVDEEKRIRAAKLLTLKEDLKGAALSGQSASQAMRSVVRAEIMEAVSGAISSIFKNVPFPFNFALAAGAGALVSGLVDKQLAKIPQFAEGFDGVVTKPTMFIAGEAGAESVQVTNLTKPGGGANAPQQGLTINFSGNISLYLFYDIF